MSKQGYIHFQTKNTSFLKISSELCRLGIKNYSFFLQLHDSDLIDVDPFDDDLTDEMKRKVFIECVNNPWYYLRECVRVDSPEANYYTGESFTLTRGTLAVFFLLLNNISHFAQLPDYSSRREIYNIFMIYVLNFGSYKYIKNIEEKVTDITNEIDKIESLLFKLPQYLKSNSIFRIKNNLTNDGKEVRVKSIHLPEERHNFAKSIRGANIGVIIFHDSEYIDDIDSAFIITHPVISSRHGMMVLQSTYNDYDHRSTQFCNNVKRNAIQWQESYYDLGLKELNVLLRNSTNNFIYVKYNWDQLGHTKEWLDQIKRLYNNDETKLKRRIFLERD